MAAQRDSPRRSMLALNLLGSIAQFEREPMPERHVRASRNRFAAVTPPSSGSDRISSCWSCERKA